MNTVLVTGANGFVGNHVIDELLSHKIKVIGVGGEGGSSLVSNKIGNYLVIDLTNPAQTQQIDFSHVDGVIHLAGLAAVGPSFDEPMKYIDTNIGIETNLFETAIKQNAKPRFLIISSGSLYDSKATLPLTEKSAVLPNSPYAASKLGQEQMAKYYASRGFEIVIARPFNHIGPGQNPGFIVPDLAQQIIQAENGDIKEISVGNLDAKRDYTDVRDIVRAYRLLLESGEPGETYNICSGKSLSGHEILEGLLKASGHQLNVKQDPAKMRPSDTPLIYGSHDKISKQTGWQPEVALQKTFEDVIGDWRSRKTI